MVCDVVEIVHLKKVAVSVKSVGVTLWDMQRGSIILEVGIVEIGLGILLYSVETHLLLLSIWGSISVHGIDKGCNDSSEVGELIGHTSTVEAMACISGTSMVVSADDRGMVRVWDLTGLKYLQ